MVELLDDFVGLRTLYEAGDGAPAPRCYLDSAASTLPLASALHRRTQLLDYYGSPHTGLGAASEICTEALALSRRVILDFFGFPPEQYYCLFVGAGATGALNRAAALLAQLCEPGDAVALTLMEHHSNDLPHRQHVGRVVHVDPDAGGGVDLAQLERVLGAGRIGYVAVTACSNVTGVLTPLTAIADLARAHGCPLLVDGAQLAAHHRLDAPEKIDAFVFCGHKAYAPGTPGVLIMRRDLFERAGPLEVGGGMVRDVTRDRFELATDRAAWAQAGTPDVAGAFQIGMVLRELQEVGINRLAARERALTGLLLARLAELPPTLRCYGPADAARRIGVVPFNIAGLGHQDVAWGLNADFGITVRSGCFCARPYVRHLLAGESGEDGAAGDGDGVEPGMVRASLGAYTTEQDIERLAGALAVMAEDPARYAERVRRRRLLGAGGGGRDFGARVLQRICG